MWSESHQYTTTARTIVSLSLGKSYRNWSVSVRYYYWNVGRRWKSAFLQLPNERVAHVEAILLGWTLSHLVGYGCNSVDIVCWELGKLSSIFSRLKIDPSGRILILGFADGVIRVVAFDLEQTNLIQAIKAHKSEISRMSINNGKSLLISGSVDRTIFIFRILKELPNITLEPIGFISTPSSVTAFNWKPQSVISNMKYCRWVKVCRDCPFQFATALVGCEHGEILQFEIVESDLINSSESYELSRIKMNQLKFKSIKSQIRRDKKLLEIKRRKAAKRLMKIRKLKELRRQNPDIRIDEDAFLGKLSAKSFP